MKHVLCACGYMSDPMFCTKCGEVRLRKRPRWVRMARLPLTFWRFYRLHALREWGVTGVRAAFRCALVTIR